MEVRQIRAGDYHIMLNQIFNLRSFNMGHKSQLKTDQELIQKAIDMGLYEPYK